MEVEKGRMIHRHRVRNEDGNHRKLTTEAQSRGLAAEGVVDADREEGRNRGIGFSIRKCLAGLM